MQSRYDSAEAARWVHELTTPPNHPAPVSELLALRTYTARLIGREADLVLHGGGNTSVKATRLRTENPTPGSRIRAPDS